MQIRSLLTRNDSHLQIANTRSIQMSTFTTKGIHVAAFECKHTDNCIDAIFWLSLRTTMHDTVFFIILDTRFT